MIPLRRAELPPPFEGFTHIHRYWDEREHAVMARVQPGDFYVGRGEEIALTILGSCVSACIWVPRYGIGGMNHFMLPEGQRGQQDRWNRLDKTSASTRYGNFAMERLVNELLKVGARREELEIKLVGGGRMWSSHTDVGSRNIAFVLEYLRAERLRVVATDVGGDHARRVHYHLGVGRLRVLKLTSTGAQDVRAAEERYKAEVEKEPVGGDVELF
jgi:chemotaxis protein CheD